MGLSKNITLTIKDYEIKLDKEIKFYENDTIDLCFSILEYGIEVKDGISINKLMPIQALRSYMLIETPHGIDYAESTKIEDNKIVFNLGTKYSQFVGIGRMQIVVKDSDGCRVTLPEFEFEIKESINMNWDRESFDFLATEDDSIIIDEFGRKIHMSKISDMPESENLSEESYAMIIDEEGNKRFKVRAIVDAVEHSLDDKFNAYTDEINGDVEEFKGSVRTNITTLTNENNTFKNQVNISLANYGSDYNNFKDNVEARLGEHMTDYNRFKDDVETRIEESESTYDGFVSNVSTVLDNYGSTYNAFKSEVDKANTSFRNTLNASNQVFKNEMVDRYDNFIYKIDEDIFEGGRTDYFGETHEKIGERLDLDFDVVHQRINDSGLMEYEGCSITANNTYYGRQKETVIKGRTLQNLSAENGTALYGTSGAGRGFAMTYNDGYMEYETQPSSDTTYITIRANCQTMMKSNTTYTIIFDIRENNIPNYRGVTVSGTSDPFYVNSQNSQYRLYHNSEFTLDKGVKKIVVTTGNNVNEYTGFGFGFRPVDTKLMDAGLKFVIGNTMVLEGDHTNTPLEELPFIEGIESVGDKSKNLVNLPDINDSFISTNEYIGNQDNSVYYKNIDISELVGIHTISMTQYFNGVVNNQNRFFLTKKPISATHHNSVYAEIANDGGSEYSSGTSIDLTEYKYLTITSGNIVAGTIGSEVNMCISDIQIEEGTQATPYQEYYDGYKISGKSIGKNLFNKENMEISDLYVPQGENNIVKAQTLRGFIMKIKSNTDYVLSKSYRVEDCLRVYGSTDYPMVNGNAKNLAYGDGSNQVVFNTEQFKYIFCVCYTNKEGSNIDEVEIRKIFDTIQLEESTKLTPYEPYKESNYSYILNEPLRSLPNGVCDEIDLTTGVLTRRVTKYVFNGSEENWINTGYGGHDTKNTFEIDVLIGENTNYNNPIVGYCNNFRFERTNQLPNVDGIRISRSNTGVTTTRDYILVSPNTSLIPYRDTTKWKEYLKENNLVIYIESLFPTTEQLTPQQLKSFDITTHVISDNKLMPVVSTKIPTDLGAMVETLSLRNRELEEVNEQQDELIDITMMATDEMYSMLEPLMEAVEPMGLLDCSKMAQMYVAMVRRGIKRIEDVPSRYQEEVKEVLGIKIEEEEWGEDDGIK